MGFKSFGNGDGSGLGLLFSPWQCRLPAVIQAIPSFGTVAFNFVCLLTSPSLPLFGAELDIESALFKTQNKTFSLF